MNRSCWRRFAFAILIVVALGTASSVRAQFNINVDFSGDTGLTTSQRAVFTTAASTWQSYITGYQPGVNLTGITIAASGVDIDGAGKILGQAGPNNIVQPAGTTTWYTSTGQMQFDKADLANLESSGSLMAVILHEMAHVIGIGTLWTDNGLYVNGTGQYTGANALAAYKTEFNQPTATFVPVELGGGGGTADGHWDEVDGGSADTGIKDSQNRDFKNELMTGWINEPYFISDTTIESFADLGYVVSTTPVPEPMALLAFAGVGLLSTRLLRRRGREDATSGETPRQADPIC